MSRGKKLSSSFSSGGGGNLFETNMQAYFVTLMYTGGYVPYLPTWPIVKIKLQTKVDGFNTDDITVFVESEDKKEQRKLLGNIKSSITITKGSKLFGEVMRDAWNDFNNSKVFDKDKDVIALITGPLSTTDRHNVNRLLEQAEATENADEFFQRVKCPGFKTSKNIEKLNAIQEQLKAANGGNDISKDELYRFLQHFRLIEYDLEHLLTSMCYPHIRQVTDKDPKDIWARIFMEVSKGNPRAKTFTHSKPPKDLQGIFEMSKTDWEQHPNANELARAILIGAWDEKNKNDTKVIAEFLGISYDTWEKKALIISHTPHSPLSLKNGIWRVVNRVKLLEQLGSYIRYNNLDTFKSLAVAVLKEPDPAFELPANKRFAASIYGKEFDHSYALRKGISEGLAILGSQPSLFSHCSKMGVEDTSILAIRKIFDEADWVLWGSLDSLLPTLAEAAPSEFLNVFEKTLRLTPCPLDELFSQEGSDITSKYPTGMLFALETLAWEEQYLIRVCVVLGELAVRYPRSHLANHPFRSLIIIFLPWYPQTLASVEKRKVAVKKLLEECPDIGWNLVVNLLPNPSQYSFGTRKPRWQKIIPDGWKKKVTDQEYWNQMPFYAKLAVDAADNNIERLTELIDLFGKLSNPAFDKLIEALTSPAISKLPEETQLPLWKHLMKFVRNQKRSAGRKLMLSNKDVTRIEKVAENLAPTNPLNLYQPLFTGNAFDFYEENIDWKDQQKKLDEQRKTAITEIFQQDGIEGVILFSKAVASPRDVGKALDSITDEAIEERFLPLSPDTEDKEHVDFVSGFIEGRYQTHGWEWCDNIDKSGWTPEQVGHFLTCLPFTKEAWDRAYEWLKDSQGEYWSRTDAATSQVDSDLAIAIKNLILHDRPYSAIGFLKRMHHHNQEINVKQCVEALLAIPSTSEQPNVSISNSNIRGLIKFLQSKSSAAQEDIRSVEWAHLSLLRYDSKVKPKFLERRLASKPEFFCEVIQVIQLIYRSENKDQPAKELSEKTKAVACHALNLLNEWKTPPGIQEDGTFSTKHFNEWIQRVKEICLQTGHLGTALRRIGMVLAYTPSDPRSGLWIHSKVAEALNDPDAEDMRNGFHNELFFPGRVHEVDPTGEPEKKLAEEFRGKAEEVEDAGFHLLATTLRRLVKSYEQEAERIIARSQQ